MPKLFKMPALRISEGDGEEPKAPKKRKPKLVEVSLNEDGYCPRGTMIFTACKGQYTHPVSGKITNLAQHVLYCQFCQPKDKEI